VHLSANHPPLIRVAGKLRALRKDSLEAPDLKHMIYTLMDDRQRQAFERELELNFSFSIEPTIRYRINVHNQRGNVEAAFRRIEPAVRTVQELALPPIVERFAEFQDGLVLVTGPTGAGKTTTVAAMVDHINRTRAAVVITLENPIEYVYPYKQSVIKQREVGVDTRSFPIALREAMRQDPDVIVVGEVRDEVTMKTALDAAETGHLVLATFPAADCAQSILRVIHFFRKERQGEVQLQLSNCLRAIISERLLPRIDAVGVIPATEILVNTSAIAHLIRSGSIEQVPSVIQTSMKQGMHNLDSSLEKLQRGGFISLETVKQHSLNVEEALRRLQAAEPPKTPKPGTSS
jgi:twitching motility protein PilT